MAKKKEKTIAQKLLNNERVDSLMIFVQFVILIALLFAAICSIFVKEFGVVVNILIAAILLILGYNNYAIFKRKGFTLLYTLVGFIYLVMAVLDIYGS